MLDGFTWPRILSPKYFSEKLLKMWLFFPSWFCVEVNLTHCSLRQCGDGHGSWVPPSLSFNYSSPAHLQLANVKPLAFCLCSTAIQYLPVDVSLTSRRSSRCVNGGANTIFIVLCTWWLRGCWLQGLWGSLHCKWYLCYSWACCVCVWCDWVR